MENIDRYDSKIENSFLELEEKDGTFYLWLKTSVKRDNELLSFDTIPDRETAFQVIEWYRQQEIRGVGLTAAYAHLQSHVDVVDKVHQARVKVN